MVDYKRFQNIFYFSITEGINLNLSFKGVSLKPFQTSIKLICEND